jgi:sialate O-acetylesterase
MEYGFQPKDYPDEVAKGDRPLLRMCFVDHAATPMPTAAGGCSWTVLDRSRIAKGNFGSAVGFFFIARLYEDLKVPVGLIQSAWGGTPIEPWISREAIDSNPVLRKMAEDTAQRQAWAARHTPSWKPPQPQHVASQLFNGKISPLIPFVIRGTIWCQGESSSERTTAYYRAALETLIADWRSHWNQGAFPFYIVQLANVNEPDKQWPNLWDIGWVAVREAELQVSRHDPHSGLAVTVDLGEAKDVHYRKKREVGQRLALIALAKDYGRKVEWSGPLYESMKVEGRAIRLRFSHADGLAAKGGGPLKRFLIAGDDLEFVPAEARIDGHDVLVSSPSVARPVAVRYAWQVNPEGCNLVNAAGLPASPFTTETAATYGRRLPLQGGDFAYPFNTVAEKDSAAATGWNFQFEGQSRPVVKMDLGVAGDRQFLFWGDPAGTLRQDIPASAHLVKAAGDRYLLRYHAGGFGEGAYAVTACLLIGGKMAASKQTAFDKLGGGWTDRGLVYVATDADRGKAVRVEFEIRKKGTACVVAWFGAVSLWVEATPAKAYSLSRNLEMKPQPHHRDRYQ